MSSGTSRRPFAITLDVGSSRANHTGAWRVERPVYLDRLPPCNDACPAGENIQRWLYHAEEGDYETAWRQLVEDNPLPGITGRACYHPCETACNRAQLDEAVGIHGVERFLGDEARRHHWRLPAPADESGWRVLVVGSGPSGLSAAYHLRRLGHRVTVRDSALQPGGMMRYGIPAYRLPRDVLQAEIDAVLDLDVELELGEPVADAVAAQREGRFDAVFLAVGAQIAKRAYIPAGDSARVLDALALLRSTEEGDPPRLGRRVAVYGGGDTALDAARTALRLGATDALIVYRRTAQQMPAHRSELEAALSEGIAVRWLSTITEVDTGKIVVEKMALGADGKPQPTGELEELAADSVVLALGQEADLRLVTSVPGIGVRDGSVLVGSDMMTGHPGIFAGGDMVPAEHTITVAIGHGKRAARRIDAWLRSETALAAGRHEIARYDLLNTWYYSDAPKTAQHELELARRCSTFDEVVAGLDATNALFEARRCMSCGNCFECDNCFGVCPDNAVAKLGPGSRYAFDYDYCKGCGICATECPCGAIVMKPEQI